MIIPSANNERHAHALVEAETALDKNDPGAQTQPNLGGEQAARQTAGRAPLMRAFARDGPRAQRQAGQADWKPLASPPVPPEPVVAEAPLSSNQMLQPR